jgi:two-component system CheB/CheR fusion protein
MAKKTSSLKPATKSRKARVRKLKPNGAVPRKELALAGSSEKEGSAPRNLPYPVVGIGASAGGLEAVVALLKHLATDTEMAFVVVMHLDPRHKSKLTELLSRATNMPVREIRDGVSIERNHVYILPPNCEAVIWEKHLRLSRRADPGGALHMPIDHFFTSLAQQQGDHSIGIVLSGTGSDGTAGLGAIKAEAGITFAEAESTAKYFGMPRSAIEAGFVDAILPPEGIAAELARIAQHPFLRPQAKAKALAPFPEAGDAMSKIFFLLKQNRSTDFSLYKQSTLRRRISRRMVLQRIERMEDYVALLRSNPAELDALFDDLLINVTSFFRDRSLYSTLKKKILPRILKTKPDGGELRVWVPGCATGEEVYSLAICLSEEIARASRNLKLQIFGTDLSEATLTKARTGLFPATIAKDVSPERLRRFFSKAGGGYQISRVIRDMCTFARQNVCEDPPFSRLDLISCRNVLIYLGPELQKRCMPIFHYALNREGYLILGPSETVGSANDLFALVDKRNKIYARRNVPVPANLDFTSRALARTRAEPPPKPNLARPPTARVGPIDLQREADRIVLSEYAPSGIIIDSQMRVHEFRGRTSRYIEHASGTATLNILQMVRPSLVVDLRTAIHKALKENVEVRKEGMLLKTQGQTYEVSMVVVPFSTPPSSEKWLLVLFDDGRPVTESTEKPGKPNGKGRPDNRETEIQRLRTELDANKESLQAIVEEQEATNEELKSANEEIESSNEELQSTNEELETAKEELQSTNEELTTLNEELSNRNLEMAQMNNDLTNLLSSINIPIIMVDNGLAVRRATPLAEKVFNLIPTDIGRRLSDLKPNLSIGNVDHLIREVLDSLTTREVKVQDTQEHWYSLRIRPYRTRDNKIDGAVITLVDIDEEQRNISRLELASLYTDAILETVREPVVVLDPHLRVRKASHAFYKTFNLPPKKTDGLHFCKIGAGEWDVQAIRKLLEETLPKSKRVVDFDVELEFRNLGRRKLVFNARRLEHKGEPLILLAIEDVTGGHRQNP